MDVSFSAWRHSREESLQLKGDSFSFLFDRRYTNRLNRMSRVFFEAYVVATKELAAQEDRFPSLSEIDAKMESGAVYAFKDRLMKNTEFFEEVKISGVSYLVPRALRFIDVSGMYTDLVLNFEEGTVVLPTRRKTALLPESQPLRKEVAEEQNAYEEDATKDEAVEEATSASQDLPAREEGKQVESYPQHSPEAFEELPKPFEEKAETEILPEKPAAKADTSPSMQREPEPEKAGPGKILGMQPSILALLGAAMLLVIGIL